MLDSITHRGVKLITAAPCAFRHTARLQSLAQVRYNSSDPRLGRLIVDEYATFRDSYR